MLSLRLLRVLCGAAADLLRRGDSSLSSPAAATTDTGCAVSTTDNAHTTDRFRDRLAAHRKPGAWHSLCRVVSGDCATWVYATQIPLGRLVDKPVCWGSISSGG